MDARSAPRGRGDGVADLDPLRRLDREHRRRDPAVEPALPLDVGAEAGRHAVGTRLGHAAEGVAVALGGLDLGDHRGLGAGIDAAHGRRFGPVEVGGREPRGGRRAHRPHLEHVRAHLDPDRSQERLGDGAGRDPSRRLARAGPFQHIPHVGVAVLEDAGQVGMARSRERHGLPAPAVLLELGLVDRPRAHRRRPVPVVAVLDEERERASQRAAVTQAGARLDVVLLELLAGAPAVAGLPPGEVGPDQLVVELEPRREARDDDCQAGAVRLAGRDVGERHPAREPNPRDMGATSGSDPMLRGRSEGWAGGSAR